MAWSPNYKKNRFAVINHMKIKDYQNYESLREYYAVLNGQNPNKSVSPRAPAFHGAANPNAILANIQSGPQGPGPQVQTSTIREIRIPVGMTANLIGKAKFVNQFKKAFSASYLIPDVQISKQNVAGKYC